MKKIYSLSMALMLSVLPVIAAQPVSTSMTLTPVRAKATINPAFSRVEVPADIKPEIQAAPAEAGNAQAITFGYSASPYSAYYLMEGPIGLAVQFPADYLKEQGVVGNQITAINVASPFSKALSSGNNQLNGLQACSVFITETLGGTPVREVKANLSKQAYEMNTVALPTPYDITGENDIFICVLWENTTSNDYPIIVDGYQAVNDCAAFVYSHFKGMSNQGEILTQKDCKWTNFVPYLNTNIVLTAQVEGDNLPTNRARLALDGTPATITPNEPFSYAIAFLNEGVNTINDVDIQLTIDGQDPQTVHAVVQNYDGSNNPVEYACAGMAAGQFTCTKEGMDIPYTATITKVNGEDNGLSNVTLTGTLNCLSEYFPVNVVLEEFTSAKCGFCPIGITALEQTKEKYGKDNRFIPIAVHGPFSGEDQMNVCDVGDSYYDMISSFDRVGAPSSFAMRDLETNIYPDPKELEKLMQRYIDAGTIAGVTAKLTKIEGDDTKVQLDVEVNATLDDNKPYGISYTIVENNVGPYMQTNYYAGGQYGECYGWESKPGNVRVTYNDVARNGSAYNPPADSHFTGLKVGEPYRYSTTLSLSNVKHVENYSVVAMLINRTTKRVVNATLVKSPDFSGIDGVSTDENTTVAFGLTGAIDMQKAGNIYTMDGRIVAANVEGIVSLPAGIYLVSTPQGNAKVIVR